MTTFTDNPHLAFVNIKRFHKADPFAMPPPEGIIPQMCRALERAIRQPHVWGKKKHYMGVMTHPNYKGQA